MNKAITALLTALCLVSATASAKLPPPSDEAKAKAEEAKTKAAEAAAKEAELLAKAQDRVTAKYMQGQKGKAAAVKPLPVAATNSKK